MTQFTLPDVNIKTLLPPAIMARAAAGLSYVSHPLRLRMLEYMDVNGPSSVSDIARAMGAEQAVVSQNLKKMRDANLVRTTRRGIFVYYEIGPEYPASIFVCLRKLFGHMTDQRQFLREGYRAILPTDYTTMAANRMKLFTNLDKMRILELLLLQGELCVSEIVDGLGMDQPKVSQYLKKLYDDDFVSSRRVGRSVYYSITAGVHKTSLGCIHKRYERVGDKF